LVPNAAKKNKTLLKRTATNKTYKTVDNFFEDGLSSLISVTYLRFRFENLK
jgi:hypothetical protein